MKWRRNKLLVSAPVIISPLPSSRLTNIAVKIETNCQREREREAVGTSPVLNKAPSVLLSSV